MPADTDVSDPIDAHELKRDGVTKYLRPKLNQRVPNRSSERRGELKLKNKKCNRDRKHTVAECHQPVKSNCVGKERFHDSRFTLHGAAGQPSPSKTVKLRKITIPAVGTSQGGRGQTKRLRF